MPRENSPYIVGEYWLDKRRDGASPDVWQITTYKPGGRQVVYRSTKRRSLADAKGVIHAFVEQERSRKPQPVEECKLVPSLFVYWDEHGKDTIAAYAVATSIRIFIGFLMQDEAGVDLTVAQITPALFKRFIAWRSKPHSYEVPWAGKVFSHTSKGVVGETTSTNLVHIRAAVNHQVSQGRIPYAPKIPDVPKGMRSDPRDLVFTIDQLGAIIAMASQTPAMYRHLTLMLATAVRPVAAIRLDPAKQYDPERRLIDLHPPGTPRTRKRNPVVPVIDEMHPILMEWIAAKPEPVMSRKTAWRTIRRVLELPALAEPKTIRHTVATIMLGRGVPPTEIEGLLGHAVFKGSSAVYAKYNPHYLGNAKCVLSEIFREVLDAAGKWSAVHLLSKTGNGRVIVVDRDSAKAQNLKAWKAKTDGAAYRTRTCDPRITNARKRHRRRNLSQLRTPKDGEE